MDYISVAQAAEKWGISERSIRNYCQQGRIVGAVLNGHSWLIPESVGAKYRRIFFHGSGSKRNPE